MDHIKSSFYFKSKEDNWRVDYIDNPNSCDMTYQVYLNEEIYWDFKEPPSTNTKHPTKSQAKEIITAAKKAYKESFKIRDAREKKLNKIID